MALSRGAVGGRGPVPVRERVTVVETSRPTPFRVDCPPQLVTAEAGIQSREAAEGPPNRRRRRSPHRWKDEGRPSAGHLAPDPRRRGDERMIGMASRSPGHHVGNRLGSRRVDALPAIPVVGRTRDPEKGFVRSLGPRDGVVPLRSEPSEEVDHPGREGGQHRVAQATSRCRADGSEAPPRRQRCGPRETRRWRRCWKGCRGPSSCIFGTICRSKASRSRHMATLT